MFDTEEKRQVVVPWTVIEHANDSRAFAARLAESSIQRFGYTSISGAIASVPHSFARVASHP